MTSEPAHRTRRVPPLAPHPVYRRRKLRHGVLGLSFILAALLVGTLGYHGLEGQAWLDATVSAAMILTGMGPTGPVRTAGGKVFAIAYALFSGVVFLGAAGYIVAPFLHRILHRFHLEDAGDDA